MTKPGGLDCPEPLTDELAPLLGIEEEYYDIWGNSHTTPPETKGAIISAMGVEQSAEALRERKLRPWNRLMEPVLVVSVNNQPSCIPLHFPLEEGREAEVELNLRFEDEAGLMETRSLRGVTPAAIKVIDGERRVRVEIPCETRKDLGYYRINVEIKTPRHSITGSMRLIITPDRCHVPEVRRWGISVSLYSIRSEKNWGLGDLGDLRELIHWVKRDLGGGFVGINPLHAITNRPPFGISPYSPLSRIYSNFLYLDMENILKTSPEGLKFLGSREVHNELRSLKENDLIDYEKTASLKLKALRVAFQSFLERHLTGETPEAGEFRKFLREQGAPLESFATFMALEEHLQECGLKTSGWRSWPSKYRDPRGSAVERFKDIHKNKVLFYQFIQWLVDRQMKEAELEAEEMPFGVCKDLSVGSEGHGSDAWSYQDVFAFGISAGAPPDAFNPNGQYWGFPPLIPERLKESGYELFIQTIRKNMEHVKALRIDHALGLFRLFWIPEGASPLTGTYVRYPYEDLLRIIALESVRNETAIIAEDLGTIGKEVREVLHRMGMLSYRLCYFERDWESGAFLPPRDYPKLAISAVTTHDLPTLRGYWCGRDIEVKNRLGMYRDETAMKKDHEERERDRQFMLDALRSLLPEEFPRKTKHVPSMTPELSLAVHRFLARTPSMLVAVSLDDILGALDQQNLPGTLGEYFNWQQKTILTIKEILKSEYARTLAEMFRQEGRT